MLLHIHDAIRRLPVGSVYPTTESSRLFGALQRLVGRTAAEHLLAAAGPVGVARMPASELAEVGQVSLRIAERVVAARDVGEVLATTPTTAVKSSPDVLRYLPLGFATLEGEVLLGFALNARMTLKAVVLFAKGGSAGLSVDVRDIFVPLVRLAASAFVLCHNHPSGSPEPSVDDVTMTNRVAAVGKVLGIDLVDHVVVATGGTVSFHDLGLLPTEAELVS